MAGEPIGPRYDEFRAIVDRAVEDGGVVITQREYEFCADLQERMERYGERTYLSTAQINWLRQIEQALDRQKGLGL